MSKNNDDDFDAIVNGQGDDSVERDDGVDFETSMDVVAHYWRDFHPGDLFVKGILIVESVTPDGRSLRYQTSTPISDWEVLGMLECVKQQLNAQGVVEYLTIPDAEDDEDDE